MNWIKNNLNGMLMIFAITSLFAGVVVLFVFWFKVNNAGHVIASPSNPSINWDRTGQTGDFIGGVVGSLWSFAGLLFVILSLNVQSRELSDQRTEIDRQKKEFMLERTTNIILHQISTIDKKVAPVIYPMVDLAFKKYRNIKGYETFESLIAEVEQHELKDFWQHPHLFSQNQAVINVFRAVDNSIQLGQSLLYGIESIEDQIEETAINSISDSTLIARLMFYNYELELFAKVLNSFEETYSYIIENHEEIERLPYKEKLPPIDSLQNTKEQFSNWHSEIVEVKRKAMLETNKQLDELLSQITDDNLHGEIGTGASVGAEAW